MSLFVCICKGEYDSLKSARDELTLKMDAIASSPGREGERAAALEGAAESGSDEPLWMKALSILDKPRTLVVASAVVFTISLVGQLFVGLVVGHTGALHEEMDEVCGGVVHDGSNSALSLTYSS